MFLGDHQDVELHARHAHLPGGRGGKPWLPARDDGTAYTGSFTDPDGHVWQLMWMDQLHVVN
jgi:predicted lactoylglutathione lyase